VTPPQRLVARHGLTVIELDGEAVVYDELTGNLHHLNETAALIFSLCDGTSSAHELSADVAAAYGLSVTDIKPHVRSLLRKLKRQGLMEPHA
jgi:PqqD family protein of HPr-rel-A system